MSDWSQVKVSTDMAPTRDRVRLMSRVEMRWNSGELESLRLKEWSETKAECKATLGLSKGPTGLD